MVLLFPLPIKLSHDIAEMLLKVVVNTINQTHYEVNPFCCEKVAL